MTYYQEYFLALQSTLKKCGLHVPLLWFWFFLTISQDVHHTIETSAHYTLDTSPHVTLLPTALLFILLTPLATSGPWSFPFLSFIYPDHLLASLHLQPIWIPWQAWSTFFPTHSPSCITFFMPYSPRLLIVWLWIISKISSSCWLLLEKNQTCTWASTPSNSPLLILGQPPLMYYANYFKVFTYTLFKFLMQTDSFPLEVNFTAPWDRRKHVSSHPTPHLLPALLLPRPALPSLLPFLCRSGIPQFAQGHPPCLYLIHPSLVLLLSHRAPEKPGTLAINRHLS